MNTPVSFEIAKLLFDKSYPQEGFPYYSRNLDFEDGDLDGIDCHHQYKDFYPENGYELFRAPTIAEVVMWLYKKYEIWISVWSAYNNHYKFSYGILYRKNVVVFHETNFNENDSPTEAYSAAIEYALKNLI